MAEGIASRSASQFNRYAVYTVFVCTTEESTHRAPLWGPKKTAIKNNGREAADFYCDFSTLRIYWTLEVVHLNENKKKTEMDFLIIARELEVFSIRQCGKIPKHYTFYLSVPIAESARRVFECAKRGNSIFPLNGHEAQLRRDQFLTAYAELQSMVSQIDVAQEICSVQKEIIHKWIKLVDRELQLIKAVLDSDRKRFKNLT